MSNSKGYHLNPEGKIYPCTAIVRKCPYGAENHAPTREELYHKALADYGTGEPAEEMINELHEYGRLINLKSISDAIEKSSSPMETLVTSLEYAIKYLEKNGPNIEEPGYIRDIKKEGATRVSNILQAGRLIPNEVPHEIKRLGNEMFDATGLRPRYDRRGQDFADGEVRYLRTSQEDWGYLKAWNEKKVSPENYDASLNYLHKKFNDYSRDIHVSKLTTRSAFFGDSASIRRAARAIDDEELLIAYESNTIPESELTKLARECNDFNYRQERSLSAKANKSIEDWYALNRKIIDSRKREEIRRMIVAMELSKELDARGLRKVDAGTWD